MDAWQRYLDLATGLTDVTRKGAESVVRTLVKQGEVAADRAERAVDDLLQRSDANRKVVAALVRSETERAVGRLGFASQAEVDRLREEVAALRAQVDAGTAPVPVKKSAAARRAGAVRGTSTARRREAAAASGEATTETTSTAKKSTAKKSTTKRASAAQRRATATAAAADSGETPTPTSGPRSTEDDE